MQSLVIVLCVLMPAFSKHNRDRSAVLQHPNLRHGSELLRFSDKWSIFGPSDQDKEDDRQQKELDALQELVKDQKESLLDQRVKDKQRKEKQKDEQQQKDQEQKEKEQKDKEQKEKEQKEKEQKEKEQKEKEQKDKEQLQKEKEKIEQQQKEQKEKEEQQKEKLDQKQKEEKDKLEQEQKEQKDKLEQERKERQQKTDEALKEQRRKEEEQKKEQEQKDKKQKEEQQKEQPKPPATDAGAQVPLPMGVAATVNSPTAEVDKLLSNLPDPKAPVKYVVGGGYVVTLKTNPQRVQAANVLINSHPNLKLQMLEAFTPDKVAPADMVPGQKATPVEAACAKSHGEAIRRIRDSGAPPNSLFFVFEEDVKLPPDFQAKVVDYISQIPADTQWDILNLYLTPPMKAVDEISTHWIVPGGYWGMLAYVLTPASAARVYPCVYPIFAQVDEMIGCCAKSRANGKSTKCQKSSTVTPARVQNAFAAFAASPNLVGHNSFIHSSLGHDGIQDCLRDPSTPGCVPTAKARRAKRIDLAQHH